MSKTIIRYRKRKVFGKKSKEDLYYIQALVYYRNIFGFLVDIKWITLNKFLGIESYRIITYSCMKPITKENAKKTIEILTKQL